LAREDRLDHPWETEAVMTDKTPMDEHLEKPHEVVGPDGTRGDGRPTGSDATARTKPEQAPTEAPEERGELTSTEHAPGGDL
jgi:hypothetical protein